MQQSVAAAEHSRVAVSPLDHKLNLQLQPGNLAHPDTPLFDQTHGRSGGSHHRVVGDEF